MAKNPFKLRSGNTTPFKQMGASPFKIEPFPFSKASKGTKLPSYAALEKVVQRHLYKEVKAAVEIGKYEKPQLRTKRLKRIAKTSAKVGGRALLSTGLLAGELLYGFGKESIRRKKAGLSGFNISESKKNKGFDFDR